MSARGPRCVAMVWSGVFSGGGVATGTAIGLSGVGDTGVVVGGGSGCIVMRG